ncbi:sensor histidine kinase [Salinisphaera aquimarina]
MFLGALAWIVVALVVTGLVLSLLFRQHLEDELARRLDADFLQLVSQLSVDANGRLVQARPMSDPLYQRVFSGRYWQVDSAEAGGAAEPLLRSRSLWQHRLDSGESDAASGPRRIVGVRATPLLAIARDITLPRRAGALRLTVAADLRPVENAVHSFIGALMLALGVLALGLIAAAALQVGLGLRPLRRLRAELGAIRRAASTRVSGDYPGEVAPLVADLNTVLAANESLIERARDQAGNLAHALKTPLSVIGNEADRLGREGDTVRATRLQREVQAMRRQVDWHLARTRIAGTRRAGLATPVAPVLARLQRTLQRLHGEAGLVIDVDCDDALVFAGESQDLEQMLGNLMDNACKWARGVIEVRVLREDGRLCLCVDDDGHGLDTAQREQALVRGQRFDETTPGSGLGLAIVSDLAAAYDGALVLEAAALGGLSAQLWLPAAG